MSVKTNTLRRISWLLVGLGSLCFGADLQGQVYQQTIRGQVIDADTGQPLAGATVQLKPGDQGGVTDSTGWYRVAGIEPGRYTLWVSYVGYESLEVPEILMATGKESLVSVSMKPTESQLSVVTVRAPRLEARSQGCPTVRVLTIEETLRFPATFYDPARLALLLPGVVQANDQSNAMSIRGHSPQALSWRLEGMETVNLNHTANAGTLSDGSTLNGGGVNALSAQLLDNSQLYNGVFPLAYGNAIGGVLDMRLRAGNNEQREHTFQAGFIGVDLATEGPFKKGGRASYLVNYRYSFTGLLSDLGVPLGDETIRFQDLSFNLVFPARDGSKLTFFGVLGLSSNYYEGPADSTQWTSEKEAFDFIDFKSGLANLGFSYSKPIRQKGLLSLVGGWSGQESSRRAEADFLPFAEVDEETQNKYSLNALYRYRFRPGQVLESGAEWLHYNQYLRFDRSGDNPSVPYANYLTDFDTDLLAAYARWRWEKPHWQASAGARLTAANQYTYRTVHLAPRGYLIWLPTERQQLELSYGLHQQFTAFRAAAHHLVLGYQHKLTPQLTWRMEAYAQRVLPLEGPASLAQINGQEVADLPSLPGVNRARYLGVESSLQRLVGNGWYYLLTATLYQATYQRTESDTWLETRFSGRFAGSAIVGREWAGQAADQQARRLGFNLAIYLNGGQRVAPIDQAQSQLLNWTVFQTANGYPEQLPTYFRTDLRVYFQRNRTNWNSILSLDIQNVTSYQNVAYRYYDRLLKAETDRNQLSLIPVISYRVSW